MKVLLGCDVDPVLPAPLTDPPRGNIWQCLDRIDDFVNAAADALPPITWLIRADESVRFCTAAFDSGYVDRRPMWSGLVARGHELGWHFHVMSFDAARGRFGFDGDPIWLGAARDALERHFRVRATRTGWDYASTPLVRRLDALGIAIDFSALPGQIAWQRVGDDSLVVDWRRCPESPYHPAADDYQQPGALALLEVPITPFTNSAAGILARVAWRARNGCWSSGGLRKKTRKLTERWTRLPARPEANIDRFVWAFYFHPEDLTREGIAHALRNINRLRDLADAEFVCASTLVERDRRSVVRP
jgi:hypothetical protein